MALLYPPILLDSAPAFINNSFKIFFELSPFNSINDINTSLVQITVIKQSTNTSMINTPSGIKMATLELDDDKYCVSIKESDIRGSFEQNQFYKVQMRFTSKDLRAGDFTTSWFYENRGYFSQWSKVCLIKKISTPVLYINGFNEQAQKTTFNSSTLSVNGYLKFEQNDREYLRDYKIKIYQTEDPTNIVLQTDQIYTNINDPNSFYYEIEEELLNSIDYTMQFTYTTNNGYTETKTYNFIIIEYGFDAIDVSLTTFPDEENGRIMIKITPTSDENFIGNFTIRRTSSKSDFHKWEDIKNYTFLDSRPLDLSIYDNTIESGVWYKYGIQKRNVFGDRGVIVQTQEPVICIFQHIFLSTKDRQLKIQFNPSLNEFKYNVTEVQQNTIGSKYPYIKRNGANYYRSFPIGGLISSLSDTTDWYNPHFEDGQFKNDQNELKLFTSKEEIYSTSSSLYQNYNWDNRIDEYNDFIYEREFREKVYDFLYQHNVKLFRSTTEGNILVKLMNIDFQPIEILGRRLYSFTATAIEVDKANIKNYDKYNIQSTGEYQTQVTHKEEVFGQISGELSGDIMSKINNKYKGRALQGFQNTVSSLKWIKIEIESTPYVIIEQNGKLIKGHNPEQQKDDTSDATYGYIVNINGNDVIIYPRMQRRVTFSPITPLPTFQEDNEQIAWDEINESNFVKNTDVIYLGKFELKDNNVSIESIKFPYPVTASITYVANLEETESSDNTIKNYYYYHKVGQLYGSLPQNKNMIKKIYDKYIQRYDDYYQQLLEVKNVEIEAPPGTICYIKDSKDTDLNRHIIENGFLRLKDDEASIVGLYFYGIQLQAGSNSQYLRNNQYYIIEDNEYRNFFEITSPKPNHVYTVNFEGYYIQGYETQINILALNPESIEHMSDYYQLLLKLLEDYKQQFIYYNGKWYPFNNGVVLCPIDGIINYYCDVIKGEYRR